MFFCLLSTSTAASLSKQYWYQMPGNNASTILILSIWTIIIAPVTLATKIEQPRHWATKIDRVIDVNFRGHSDF